MKLMKILITTICFIFTGTALFALPFNSNLTENEKAKLNQGEVLIKNIDYQKNMCLLESYNETTKTITKEIKNYNPKYLAEIIMIKPYEVNKDLPDKLNTLLNNISDYAGIPYWSERHERYYDLYSSAKITKKTEKENRTTINADLEMEPFGLVQEVITIDKNKDFLLYRAKNSNNLKYEGITCVSANKLNIHIYVFRYEDKWIVYGIGGVNAPHLPFLTDRIRVSFINRIKTFCNFIFSKL